MSGDPQFEGDARMGWIDDDEEFDYEEELSTIEEELQPVNSWDDVEERSYDFERRRLPTAWWCYRTRFLSGGRAFAQVTTVLTPHGGAAARLEFEPVDQPLPGEDGPTEAWCSTYDGTFRQTDGEGGSWVQALSEHPSVDLLRSAIRRGDAPLALLALLPDLQSFAVEVDEAGNDRSIEPSELPSPDASSHPVLVLAHGGGSAVVVPEAADVPGRELVVTLDSLVSASTHKDVAWKGVLIWDRGAIWNPASRAPEIPVSVQECSEDELVTITQRLAAEEAWTIKIGDQTSLAPVPRQYKRTWGSSVAHPVPCALASCVACGRRRYMLIYRWQKPVTETSKWRGAECVECGARYPAMESGHSRDRC